MKLKINQAIDICKSICTKLQFGWASITLDGSCIMVFYPARSGEYSNPNNNWKCVKRRTTGRLVVNAGWVPWSQEIYGNLEA